MEDKKKTPKFMIILVLIVILLTGISVAFGYFIWNSNTNKDISFTVEGAMVYSDGEADIEGANLVPVKSYTSRGAVKKNIGIKLKSDVDETVIATMKLNINEISQYLAVSNFKWTLVKDNTIVSEGNFNGKSNSDVIELVTLSNANTVSSNKHLSSTLSNYILYLWKDGNSGNDSNMQDQGFDFALTVEGTIPAPNYLGTEVVESLDDGSTGDSGSGVYKVHHDEISSADSVTGEVIPAVDDYRYYGANPNNYICLDYEGKSTCPDKHLYRIIGSIYDELTGENRLKVIKATALTDGTVDTFAWDMKSDETYANIWATPTETRNNITNNYSNSTTSGSTLMIMLNSGIWWSDTANKGKMYYYYYYMYTNIDYYDKSGIHEKDVDFTNYKLSGTAKSMIGNSRYYLAGHNASEVTTTTMYTYERTKTGNNSGRYDTNRPLYWEGKVALMYPSDYGYAAGSTCATRTNLSSYSKSCYQKDWLYIKRFEWLQSPYSVYPDYACLVHSDGYVNGSDFIGGGSVRPVFYLTPDVIITVGTGEESNPYVVTRG